MSTRIFTSVLFALALVCASTSIVSAQDGDDGEKVEQLSNEGTEAYKAKEYKKAIKLFKKAYDIEAVPNLLFNIAKCYEKQKEWDDAIEFYQQFSDSPDIDSDARALAEKRIENIEDIKQTDKKKVVKKDDPDNIVKDAKDDPKPVGKPDYTTAYIVVGSGIGLIGGGAIFGILAQNEESKFVAGETSDIRKNARDTGTTYALVADGMYVAGAIATGIGLYLFATASPEKNEMSASGFGWFGKDEAGVGINVRY